MSPEELEEEEEDLGLCLGLVRDEGREGKEGGKEMGMEWMGMRRERKCRREGLLAANARRRRVDLKV